MPALPADVLTTGPPHSARARHRQAATRSAGILIPAAAAAAIVLACFVWPLIGGVPPPVGGSILAANLPIGAHGHLLGTDPVGNDIFSRILYGGRTSIEIGLATNAIGILIGGTVGILAAYLGGLAGTVATRVIDVLLAFPALILALVIAAYSGPGELHVIWALSFFTIPAYARLARAHTLRVKQAEFINAAEMAGTRPARIVIAHIAPHVLQRLSAFVCLGVAISIMFEAALSFLGLGVVPPAPSWGDMIAQGQEYLITKPALVAIPSVCLLVTVVTINLLGDGIQAHRSA